MTFKMLLVPALLLACAPAFASSPVDITRPLDADGSVSVQLVAGSVKVVGSDRNEVHVTGTIGNDVPEVEVTGSPQSLTISVRLRDHGSNNDADADLQVQVPRGAEVSVSSVSAPITASDVTGRLALQTVSAEVVITGAPRRVRANSVSGHVSITSSQPLEAVSVDEVSGDVNLDLALAKDGELRVNTVSGAVTAKLPADAAGDFSVNTFSGAIRTDFGKEPEHRGMGPGSGLKFSNGKGGKYNISTFSGSVSLKKR